MTRRRNARTEETVPPPDWAHVVTELQRQLTEQQQMIAAMMNQQGMWKLRTNLKPMTLFLMIG